MLKVCYVYPPAYHYRHEFNERLRHILLQHNIDYSVIYSDLGQKQRFKNDTIDIPWGKRVPLTRLFGGLEYQHSLREALKCDLVIIQQENKLLLNYLLNLLSLTGVKKVAYFGHGRNFQSRRPTGLSERLKRFWATKVDWWFGYTEETGSHIASLGFPANRISIFNNTVDTQGLLRMVKATSPERLEQLRCDLSLSIDHTAIFVGSLYEDRRLPFLMEAADLIRTRVPDFNLVFVGGGQQLAALSDFSSSRPWVKVMGPRFHVEKVELMLLSKVLLMPGLVGLAVVDAGAAELPTITTAFPYHSPEIAYVKDGINGLIINDWENPQAYANAVSDLLTSPDRLRDMRQAALHMSQSLTTEAMAERFAEGVISALDARRRFRKG